MKTRLGFVSNSSSSSYIIRNTGLSTISVAKTMLSTYDDSRLDDFERLYNSISEFIQPDQAIIFSSCNYNTHITKQNSDILIDTCNNENWNLPSGSEYTEELDENNFNESEWYWDIDNDLLVHSKVNYRNVCTYKKHYEYKRKINYSTEEFCIKCYKGKKYSELLKEKIRKNKSFNLRNI